MDENYTVICDFHYVQTTVTATAAVSWWGWESSGFLRAEVTVTSFSSDCGTTATLLYMLMESSHYVEVGKLVDVRKVASDLRGCSRGASMEKDALVGRSDWDDEELGHMQVKYACHDVLLAFLMAIELRVWNWVDDNYD